MKYLFPLVDIIGKSLAKYVDILLDKFLGSTTTAELKYDFWCYDQGKYLSHHMMILLTILPVYVGAVVLPWCLLIFQGAYLQVINSC